VQDEHIVVQNVACVYTKSEYWSSTLWIISADLSIATELHSIHNELTKWSEACRFILRRVLEVRFLTSVNVSSTTVNNVSDLWVWNDSVTVTSPPSPMLSSGSKEMSLYCWYEPYENELKNRILRPRTASHWSMMESFRSRTTSDREWGWEVQGNDATQMCALVPWREKTTAFQQEPGT